MEEITLGELVNKFSNDMELGNYVRQNYKTIIYMSIQSVEALMKLYPNDKDLGFHIRHNYNKTGGYYGNY